VPDVRVDPLTGRRVVIAPARARRPGAGVPHVPPPTAEELESCPFCESREERTPPETLALPARTPRDSPGWAVRVVPNLFPAFERQEVVVHAPHHVRSFAELDDAQVALVAEAWRLRAAAARDEGIPYVHALVNEGREAGASLAHSHSQLVCMSDVPPLVAAEQTAALKTLLEEPCDLGVAHHGGVATVCHPAGRAPYEMVIGRPEPSREGGLGSEGPADLLLALRDAVRRLRTVEGPVPWNAWLHDGDHPHVELVPRLAVFAGVELGAGIYVNPLPPERAAELLGAAVPS